jgi:hypothetical protein
MIFAWLVGDIRHEWSHLALTNALCNPPPRKSHYYKCLLGFRDVGNLLIASRYISRIIRATRSYRLVRERTLIEMAWQMCYKLQEVAAIRPPDRRQPNRFDNTAPFNQAPKWLQRRWVHDKLRGRNTIIRRTGNTNPGVSGPRLDGRPAFPWVYPKMYRELNPDAPEYNARELKSIQDMHQIIPPDERLKQYTRGRPTNLYADFDINFINPHTKYAYHYNIYERRHPDGDPIATSTHESFYEYIWDRELRHDEYYDQDQALLEDDMQRAAEDRHCENNYVDQCGDAAIYDEYFDQNQALGKGDMRPADDDRDCENNFVQNCEDVESGLNYGGIQFTPHLQSLEWKTFNHDIFHAAPHHTGQTTIAYTENDYLLLEELDCAVQSWEEETMLMCTE